MNASGYIAIVFSGIAMVLGLTAILRADLKRDTKKLHGMSDAGLLANGLWDECDGEPMNIYADEYERRHGILSTVKTAEGKP